MLINIRLCASPMLNQVLKMMNSKNTKTQRQRHNKFHIPGLAKRGAVLAALVTDGSTRGKRQPYSEDNISPRFRAHRSMTALTTPRWRPYPDRSIQSTPFHPCFFKIDFVSSIRLSHQNNLCTPLLSHACHMHCPSHRPSFAPNYIPHT